MANFCLIWSHWQGPPILFVRNVSDEQGDQKIGGKIAQILNKVAKTVGKPKMLKILL